MNTGSIFNAKDLPRNTKPITSLMYQIGFGHNDCEKIVKSLYKPVDEALSWLLQFAPSRMTGTGSAVFAAFTEKDSANAILSKLPSHLQGFVAKGCSVSPLHAMLAAHFE